MKLTSNIDIRSAGSGNVGGRNALDVSGKKWVGIVVVAVDIIKGIAAVSLSAIFPECDVISRTISMGAVVTGHCYPVWLRWKGGRGLATAAGVFFWYSWLWVPVWLALYFLSEKVTKNIHVSSVLALVGTPLAAWLLPETVVTYMTPGGFTPNEFLCAGSVVIAVSISRHIGPLLELTHQKDSHEK